MTPSPSPPDRLPYGITAWGDGTGERHCGSKDSPRILHNFKNEYMIKMHVLTSKKWYRGKSKLYFSNRKEPVMTEETWGFSNKMRTVVHSAQECVFNCFVCIAEGLAFWFRRPFPPKMSKLTSSNTWCQQKLKSRVYIFFSLNSKSWASCSPAPALAGKREANMWEGRSGVKVRTCLGSRRWLSRRTDSHVKMETSLKD